MWRTLIRKTFADYKSRWLETLMIIIVAAVASATMMLAFAVNNSIKESYLSFIDQAGAGHAWFFTSDFDLMGDIASLPEVDYISNPIPALDQGVSLSTSVPYDISFFGHDPETDGMSFGVLTQGRWPAGGPEMEAVLDRGMAEEAELSIGDTLTVRAVSGTTELRIVGLAIPTSRPPYPVSDYVRVFVTQAAVGQLAGGVVPYRAMGVRLENPNDIDTFMAKTDDLIGERGAGSRSWNSIRDIIAEEESETWVIMGVFSFFVMIASVLVVANTLAGRVTTFGREFALLKTIGASPMQVVTMMVTQVAFIGVIASVLGVLVARPYVGELLGSLRRVIGPSVDANININAIWFPIVTVTAVLVVGSLLPALAAGRVKVAEALAGKGVISQRINGPLTRRLVGITASPVRMGIGELLTTPTRMWLTVAAVALAGAVVFSAMTLRTTFDRIIEEPQIIGVPPVDFILEGVEVGEPGKDRSRITEAELIAILSENEDVEAFINQEYFSADIEGVHIDVFGVGGDVENIGYLLIDGRAFREIGEAMVGLGLARDLELGVGDTFAVTLDDFDEPFTLSVSGIYVEDSNNGRGLMIPIESVRIGTGSLSAGTYAIRMRDGTNLAEVPRELIDAAGGRIVIRDIAQLLDREVGEVRDKLMPALNALTGLMVLLALISLTGTLTRSVQERRRGIAILRAVGFTPAQTMMSVVAGAVAVGVIGGLIGAPLGWAFDYALLSAPFTEQGYSIPHIIATPGPIWIALVFAGSIGIAIIASAVPGWKAANSGISDGMRQE